MAGSTECALWTEAICHRLALDAVDGHNYFGHVIIDIVDII